MTVFLIIPYLKKNKFHFFTCLPDKKPKQAAHASQITLSFTIMRYPKTWDEIIGK